MNGNVLPAFCYWFLGYNVSYSNDKQYGKSVYRVGTDAKKIAIEIMTNGPVQADYTVYTDFFSYKSGKPFGSTCEWCTRMSFGAALGGF